jgi:hypothetical protein
LLKASSAQVPAQYLPAAVVKAGSQTSGWQLLTTYLSHFWFEQDLQKPGKSWSENLEDDTYEIEVELWPTSPPQSDQLNVEPGLHDDILLKAYRQTHPTPGAPPGAVPDITRLQLVTGLAAWLRDGQGGATLLERPPLLVDKALPPEALLRTFRITRPIGAGDWTLTETTAVKPGDGVGAAVAFEVLARTDSIASKGPKYDDIVNPELASVLIRVSVLDHPFRVSRARLRVVRNWRDIGGDNIPDIARDFYLADRFSDWKSEGRAPAEIDESDFNRGNVPPQGRQLRATSATALSDWLTAIDDRSASVNHGQALRAALAAKTFHNSDSGKDEGLWEPIYMGSKNFTVDGMVNRLSPDISFAFGKADNALDFETRTLVLAGDPLQNKNGDQLDELLAALRPSRIKSDQPIVTLVWRDQEQMPVLRLSLPLNLKP